MYMVLTSKQMREVDRYMIEEMHIPSLLLMENAARGVCGAVMEEDPCVVHAFCGTGNNGGDGLAAARVLLAEGYDVYVVVLGEKQNMTPDALENYLMFETMPDRCRCIGELAELEGWDIPEADLIIDAIFGTGLSREVSGLQKDCIAHINESGVFVVACDIPSGVNANDGKVMGSAVYADVTVTFQYPKIGHFLYPGREYAGEVEVVKIGVDEGCEVPASAMVQGYESGDEDISLGFRRQNAHKGDFGRLLLIAGSSGMAGAAVLSARAAGAAGAGLVTVASTDEVVSVLQHNVPEATCKVIASEEGVLERHSIFDIDRIIKGKSALAIGPGLGTGNDLRAIVSNIVQNHEIVKVMDADAINALAGAADILIEKKGDIILTPHMKEFAGLLDVTVDYVLGNSLSLAVEFAKKYGVVLVLKGATTIVADADGRAALVGAGSPGMAKGGSGDVLTGTIAGFAAQGKSAFDAALIGVYIAATAGELAAGEYGEYSMTPSDTVDYIGDAIETVLDESIWADTVKKKAPGKNPVPPREESPKIELKEDMIVPPEPTNKKPDPEPDPPTKRKIG